MRPRRSFLPRCIFAALLLSAHPCAAQDTTVYSPPLVWPRQPAMALNVLTPTGALPVGVTYWVHASVSDSVNNTFHPTIRWRSSDTTIVTVGATGESNVPLIGHRAGRAVVTAYTDKLVNSFVVFVGRIPPVARLEISPKVATLRPGESIRYLAIARDTRGRPLPTLWLRWSWSDTLPVRWLGTAGDHELFLQGAHDGELTVYADLGGKSAQATLVIGNGGKPTAIRAIELSPRDTVVRAGADVDFTAIPVDAGGAALGGRLVRWSLCDTTVMRIWTFKPGESTHMQLHAVRPGTCRVTASADGIKRSSRVVVRP